MVFFDWNFGIDGCNKQKNDENNVLKAWKRYRSQNGVFSMYEKISSKCTTTEKKIKMQRKKKSNTAQSSREVKRKKQNRKKILLRGLLFSKISGGD